MKKNALNRIIALTLALSLALGLCACGGEPTAAEETPLPESTSEVLPEPAEVSAALAEAPAVRLSEVMCRNHAAYLAPDGGTPDYIELYNASGAPVSLEGWLLYAGEDCMPLPSVTLAAGACTAFECRSLPSGSELRLCTGEGTPADSFLCPETREDRALVRGEDGSVSITEYPSPGYPNTGAGYDAWQSSLPVKTGLVISELMTSNDRYEVDGAAEDWVELCNRSDEAVLLSDFCLADDRDRLGQQRLPEITLAPGEYFVIVCDGTGSGTHAPFSLSAEGESVYLTEASGRLVDAAPARKLPHNVSLARSDTDGGWLYCETPTPGAENAPGCRRVTAAPVASVPAGVYDGAEPFAVALTVPGCEDAEILYTTDASRPGAKSPRLDGEIVVGESCVIRAQAREPGCLPSSVTTLNYFLNEGFTLPVLCLNADAPKELKRIYSHAQRGVEVPGNVSFYEPDGSFSADCGITLSGHTSLAYEKKSFRVHFRGKYGAGQVNYDLFNSDIRSFSSLTVRSGGHDAYKAIYISELWQDLSMEMSERVLSMMSRYAVVYVNGEYYGLYAIKEDYSRDFFAAHRGVSPESVETLSFPLPTTSSFYREIVEFCRDSDMSRADNYAAFCEKVDLESFIDWIILESVSGNTDIYNNVRVFRSPECGGKWEFGFYDLDLSLNRPDYTFIALFSDSGISPKQLRVMVKALVKNEDFLDALLTRYAEVRKTTLSNEHILEVMRRYEAILEPEIPRNNERWGISTGRWYASIDRLHDLIEGKDWQQWCLDDLCRCLDLSEETRAKYFGE